MASLHIIGFRVDGEMLARIQAMKPRLSRPWHEATTSDIVRVLLQHALRLAESGSEIDGLRGCAPDEAPRPEFMAEAEDHRLEADVDEASDGGARSAPRARLHGGTPGGAGKESSPLATASGGEVTR